MHETRLQTFEGTSRVCGHSLTLASMCFLHGPVRKIVHVSRTTNEIHGCFLNSHKLHQITFNFCWKMLSLDFKLQILKIEGLILFFQSIFQFQCTFHSRSVYCSISFVQVFEITKIMNRNQSRKSNTVQNECTANTDPWIY